MFRKTHLHPFLAIFEDFAERKCCREKLVFTLNFFFQISYKRKGFSQKTYIIYYQFITLNISSLHLLSVHCKFTTGPQTFLLVLRVIKM